MGPTSSQASSRREPLDDSEARLLARAFDEAPAPLALVGLDYRFRRVNRAFCELLGYTCEELECMSFVDITHADDVESDADLAGRVFDGSIRFYTLEKRYIAKNGQVIPVQLTATVMRDADGKPICGLATISDIGRFQVQRRELLSRIGRDALTGLADRSLLDVALGEAMRNLSDGTDRSVAVAFLDVDDFKAINDAHGHPAGDQVLRELSEKLSATVRESDAVARYGGDEFVGVFKSLSPAQRVAEAITEKLLAATEIEPGSARERYRATVSIGVVVTESPVSPARMIAESDAAMYDAKAAPSGRVSIRFL